MSTLEEQIEEARKVHKSLRGFEAASDIVIRIERSPIVFNGKPYVPAYLKKGPTDVSPAQQAERTLGMLKAVQESRDLGHHVPLERWREHQNHHTLMALLACGIVPGNLHLPGPPGAVPSVSTAMKEAASAGFRVPRAFQEGGDLVSFSERNLAWTAQECLRSAYPLGMRWREALRLACHSFPVPNPSARGNAPFIIDQMWIVQRPEGGTQLFAIEVDGPSHARRSERDRRRDRLLAQLGYTTVRVAAHWCRLDAVKVLAEVIRATKLGQVPAFAGQRLSTPAEYLCARCEEPMCRWDLDWIVRCKNKVMHAGCAEEVHDHDDDDDYRGFPAGTASLDGDA